MRRLWRPFLVASLGTAFAGAAAWSVAGIVLMGSSFASGSSRLLPKPQFHSLERMEPRQWDEHAATGKAPRLLAARPPVMAVSFAAGREKSARDSTNASDNAARFDAVVKQVGLTSEKLASLFDRSSSPKSHRLTANDDVA